MNHVLVVDDDRGIREMLRAILELEGFEVELACGGLQAVDVLMRAREPYAVLMDVMMPGMSGVEVCDWLHASPTLARHRVALMTAGLLEEGDRPELACTILRKPFDLDVMVRLVTRMAHEIAAEQAATESLAQCACAADALHAAAAL